MNIANLLRTGSPAELREIGELLLQLADMPRDAGWQAMIDSTLKRFQSPDDARLVDHFRRWEATCRGWQGKLDADKTSHRQLLAAELNGAAIAGLRRNTWPKLSHRRACCTPT
jgi:hypothetical protein